ncbi:sequestosome-1-like isoform X2 [Nymphalis io]|uniref:sequestosome-1-like isoform X2 n=1 Tax=Inachis io TaxID=171585 RepID=UPI00216946BC|nr:sequestosome-1-like isoform X2 [Nymphalis io]
MEDQVPFKVYTFWNENDKPEVRRFGIEKSVVTSYHYLNAKLQDVFPGLKNKHYMVSWKDEDGDDVVISSDDEIMIALSAMEDLDLVKLYVSCKDKVTKDNDECDIVVTAVADNNADFSTLQHYGVICDGCESSVTGFRYKCTYCDDYDLCSKCEAAGLHPEHCMMRVPMPNMPRTVIRTAIKRSRNFLKNVTFHLEEENIKKQCREKSNERKRRGEHGHGHHGHGRRHSGDREQHHSRRPRTSWLETFASYMNEFANLAGDVNIDIDKKPSQDKTKENTSQAPKDEASTSTERQQPQCPFSVENLDVENIQKLLNLYLSGLNPSKPSSNNAENPQSQPQGTSVNNNDAEMGQGDRKSPEIDKESLRSDVSSTTTIDSKREETPETEKGDKIDDWTVINNEKDLMDTNVKSGTSSQPPIGFNLPEEFQERVKISDGQNLYPPLNLATAELEAPADPPQSVSSQAQSSADKKPPSAPVADKKETQPKEQHHPLLHINAAIEQMMAMGFTNDGGWLTQLLESKDGNIAAVLDLLTPVNTRK